MYKTIVAVVAFLVIALIVQLYEQDQMQTRIKLKQQAEEQLQADNEAKAEEAERARQLAEGIHLRFAQTADSVVPESFSVPNGAPKEFSITVDTTRMMDVTVTGHFAVSGDRSSGVEVYIFDEDDYTNWMYGNNSIALFASGREMMGDVRARIAKSGRYFLIFKNSTSLAAMNVKADIKMQYEKVTTPS
jgi:hypothetical protein